MINSDSLHKSNAVFVFKNKNRELPNNQEMIVLYPGDASRGVQLVDDPMMRMKVMDVPQLKIQVACEMERLRIEDMQALPPEKSELMELAVRAYEGLNLNNRFSLVGLGFNFEVFYQTAEVIDIGNHYNKLSQPLEVGDGILDFGWQWTVQTKNGKRVDGYFLKITAPLEFVLHHNAHFNLENLPPLPELKNLFKEAYEKTHRAAEDLKL